MTLFKISWRNLKQSLRDYLIYFFTLVLGVAVFYIFNALDSQAVMLPVRDSTRSILKLMVQSLSAVSVFVSFVLGFLIIYASRFMMKRRKREFAIYMVLGMGKGKISRILLFETLMIGSVSLIAGLILGVGISQLVSVFVANLFTADMNEFTFVFSGSAAVKTAFYFGIIYIMVLLFYAITVGKCRLIDLMHSGKKAESIRLLPAGVCGMMFAAGAGVLGCAYYNVTVNVTQFQYFGQLLPFVLMGIAGTFLIFGSISSLLVRFTMSRKKLYFTGLNSFTLRQLYSKIHTTVVSMSVICLMLFLTICILASGLSLNYRSTQSAKENLPVDLQIVKQVGAAEGQTPEQNADTTLTVVEALENMGYNTSEELNKPVESAVYWMSGIRMEETLGSLIDEVRQEFKLIDYGVPERFMPISDYNKLAERTGQNQFELYGDEYIVLCNFDGMKNIRDKALKAGVKLDISGNVYNPRYDECQEGYILMSSSHVNSGIFIVPDEAVTGMNKDEVILTSEYSGKSAEEKRASEDKIEALADHPYSKDTSLSVYTKISLIESATGVGAMVTFIGIYLGVVFLISSAAILSLKELSESLDHRGRYEILRKTGVEEKLIYRSLFIQTGVFFLLPLILAVIHSVFGLWFARFAMVGLGSSESVLPLILTSGMIVLIYGGYFVITYLCSKNIIKEGESRR